jgi:hypothetical protein
MGLQAPVYVPKLEAVVQGANLVAEVAANLDLQERIIGDSLGISQFGVHGCMKGV